MRSLATSSVTSHLSTGEQPQQQIERVITNIQNIIIGKRETIEHMVIAFLCGGHVLLEDVPGVGKTMLVRAIAKTIDCSFSRLQFTPDLLPSDVTGISMYNQKTNEFEFRPGPILSHIVLADEINRTSPKTQSALLEAMEEKCVTVDGVTYELPRPFFLMATQNPVDFEGTFRLPEAQLDRFMLKLSLGYPLPEEECAMLDGMQQLQHPLQRLEPVLRKEELIILQRLVSDVHIDQSLKQYIVRLAIATREHPDVRLGVSPRGSIALMKAAQGLAFIKGRSYVIPDDIKAMLPIVFTHRIAMTSEARMKGSSSQAIIKSISETTRIPGLLHVSGS